MSYKCGTCKHGAVLKDVETVCTYCLAFSRYEYQDPNLAIPPLLEASPDANVEAIRQSLLERSKVGLAKYGVTTERSDLTLVQWLTHLQEELLDAAVYIEAAKRQFHIRGGELE